MTIRELVKKDPNGIIARAYRFSEKAHAGQKRENGEPYFTHALATAETLNRWGLDETTIAAGLLHDTLEDTAVTEESLPKEFGEEITVLVEGVTKLGKVKYRGEEAKAENMRKLILALSRDLRVVFVKLADRLHNMSTLGALPPAKQKRIALETDEIYAPLAYQIGMHEVSGELHELAFPYLHPAPERWIRSHIKDEYEARRAYLHDIKPLLQDMLKKINIVPLSIDLRAKRHYSLYKKLLRYDMDIGKIYDLIALRVILDKTEDCYAALGAVHQMWPPLQGRIKDYIAMPKANHYRSLHTTVIGPQGKYIEIQFRTDEMHKENELGVAAHWLYTTDASRGRNERAWGKKLAETLPWIEQLARWQERYSHAETSPEEFLSAMKMEFFKDRVFAITPKGAIIDIPRGSTLIDFAYRIHTEIGDTCVGAKVNDRFVQLNYELQSGDVVEILTQKHKRPSEDWLRFVKTGVARDHIRAALREKRRTQNGARIHTRTEIRIVAQSSVGILKNISAIIARSHFNIVSVNTVKQPTNSFPTIMFQLETADTQKVERLVLKLKAIPEVREVTYRMF